MTSSQISVNINGSEQNIQVSKFFSDFSDFRLRLRKLQIGFGLEYAIDSAFPVSFVKSAFGFRLSDSQLHERYDLH